MAKRQQFTKEFKLEALRLWQSSGRPAAAVARELGLRRNHLYKWRHELETFGEASFPGKGGRAASADELTRLRRENARLREERDILKKAAAFFARGSDGDMPSFARMCRSSRSAGCAGCCR
jgi:transposase